MVAQKGSLVVLKAGDGASPVEGFTIVGGLRVTGLSLNMAVVDSTNRSSGAWRKLLGGAGIRRLSISGDGIFTDSAAEETVCSHAFAGTVNNYELHFGNGDKLSGPFLVVFYERKGEVEDMEEYRIGLESAGTVVFSVG